MKKLILVFLFTSSLVFAQDNLFTKVAFQNVGPTIMSGRIVDLAVNPENPTEFYAAYASGGLWYTNNNGNSFTPVMDTAPTLNCGSVTVDWKSGTIWVGTGEVNASRSSYSGIGVLKSSDKGKTWENLGLPESHHISRVLVNPKNINQITVGVVGHLYTKNKERGIYKTLDGGKTWKQMLFVNDETGIIDVVVSPNNLNVQYAAAWQKDRKAWDFKGNGKGSGIYKSTDAGNTWNLISTPTSGFPTDKGVGRVGLLSVNDNVVYAVVDNQNKRPNSKMEKPKDANAALFETEVIGCELYKSVDGGLSWKKTHENYIDDLYYSYGYYFGNIAVDLTNENRIYLGGVPLIFSEDGGKTFKSISKENVHADHHVTWINPKNSNHIINGNDGGVNITYDNGEHWFKCNNQAVGQFYTVNVDDEKPYNVYGGLQDNGVWVGPNNYEHSLDWQQDGKYPYEFIMGGDGMQVQIDSRDANIIYTGFQFGNYYRINRKKDKRDYISPKAKKEEETFRFNWQTPILLSSHNQDILYMGSQYLHRSMNQGETWDKISHDVTKGKVEGNVAFGTITAIAESDFQFGLLYVGSDDGLIHVSKDGGATWSKISDNLPQNLWVSRIISSKHKKERVYVALNGYRNDDFASYIFVSEDYGKTWKSISNNLTQSPVNVIIEDNVKVDILYVGTDNGLFISIDKGITWQDFSAEIPNVAVHDLVIQSQVKELVVATHGRSIYKVGLDRIQALDVNVLAKKIHIFDVDKIKKSERWGSAWSSWSEVFEPKIVVSVYSNSDKKATLNVKNDKNKLLFTKQVSLVKGLNFVEYDLSIDEKHLKKEKVTKAKNSKYYLNEGVYSFEIEVNKIKYNSKLTIEKAKQ
ncbi:VPS10 domain-containing protein [Flavobacterium sp.]|jgi:photosystem II stability/assembly factor-like uncharacterized protein|uniref:WD40/YVTN/BNR-like repeat-containing protein n=1 Tax=Flavobacterium sp. TaxID=239 RepID=UPI002A832AC7|nr:glycosyl hydrolase [Flavobacterium sp.]